MTCKFQASFVFSHLVHDWHGQDIFDISLIEHFLDDIHFPLWAWSISFFFYRQIYMGFASIHPLVFIKVCFSKNITKKLLIHLKVYVAITHLLKNKWVYVSNSHRHLLEYTHLFFIGVF